MTASLLVRRAAAALFAVALGLATLPGCGSSSPQAEKKDEKKDQPKTGTDQNPTPGSNPVPAPNPGSDPSIKLPPIPKPEGDPKSTLGQVDKKAEEKAFDFRKDFLQGTAKAEALSSAFLRAIGKPLVFDGDKAKGYSADSATSWTSWLKKVAEGTNLGMELERPAQAGDVMYLRGALQGKTGCYRLRMLKEGSDWKVDWFSLSSVESSDKLETVPTEEGKAQAFAVAAFTELVGDLNGMPREERMLVLAATMTSALRTAWAPPFDQDKRQGNDFNPAELGRKAVTVGGGTSQFTMARSGKEEFKVELTKPAGKKSYTVKLMKGGTPHEWLVSEVTEVK
jgi:hypothetical protein